MANDRFGIRWGLDGGTALKSIAEARSAARFAEEAGFDSFWISNALGIDPIVALACLGGEFPGLGEVGTSVVPLYGRHPVGLAQLARTAQNALGGRFTLGIGAASKRHAEEALGLSWDRPFSYTREFIDALEPLLAGDQADTDGAQISAHAKLAIEAGLLTPPFGILVYSVKGFLDDRSVTLGQIFYGSIPYWIMILIVMICVALVPGLGEWLPAAM